MRKSLVLWTFVALSLIYATKGLKAEEESIKWEKWSDEIFKRAKAENKLVLMDLEAVWCHWCHVQAETTYKDADVVALLNKKYICVRVDQDSRPDLSNRYEDYGWPATVIFDADGKELVKRRGFIKPKKMAALLQACIDDPTPGPSVEPEEKLVFENVTALTEDLRKRLLKSYVDEYDTKNKGWGFSHKYLDWDSVEYSLKHAAEGDARAEAMAKETLQAEIGLLDPVWGGVYQYSTDNDWEHPHFEKIMQHQCENLRIYSLAYAQWRDETYLKVTQAIRKYLKTFLRSPDGAFYVSQDADLVPGEHSGEYFKLDDAGRRKLGIPRVDTHIYSRENGRAIVALATLYSASGEQAVLDEALTAAKWTMKNRNLPDGGFRHDEKDVAGPFLNDSLAMGRAFLALYAASGTRQWLTEAETTAGYIEKNFKINDAGYATALNPASAPNLPSQKPQRDETVGVVRFANLLFHYTGKAQYRQMAEHAFKFLTAPPIAERLPAASVLLAEDELTQPPPHVTVVGAKSDARAQALYKAAIASSPSYLRVEWYDAVEDPLPNQEGVEYPALPEPAAYICTKGACSAPISKPEDVKAKVLGKAKTGFGLKP
jgi:uncharacterized protein YyaL (SSP411 family)